MQYSEVLSGTIDVAGTIIFTGTVGKANIYSLRFNNPAAYDITVSRYIKGYAVLVETPEEFEN